MNRAATDPLPFADIARTDEDAGTDRVSAYESDEVSAEDELGEDDPQVAPRHERSDVDALVGLAEVFLVHGVATGGRADRYQVLVLIDATTWTEGGPGVSRVAGGGPGLHPATVRRLMCTNSAIPVLHDGGDILNLGRASRATNTAQRRALQIRDHGRCRIPGCRTRRGVEAH